MIDSPEDPSATLKKTPLHDLHLHLGAKMVPFAGYEMPVQYPAGIIAEHNHTRTKAGLFDVSHMGQAFVTGADHHQVAAALEALTPANLTGMEPGRVRYTLLMNEEGGIRDDLMITRSVDPADDGRLYLVVNAACKDLDYAHLTNRLPATIGLDIADQALLALQGPAAARVLDRFCPKAGQLGFMRAVSAQLDGIDCHVSRSGYTGEDGFEISVSAADAQLLAETLLSDPLVAAIGLGARDSLRLEAGLCLYGHDIDVTTSPVEADLMFAVPKRRQREGGFPGWQRLMDELDRGPARKRVGVLPNGRIPAREGTEIFSAQDTRIGQITSGGFSPTLGIPLAMGYLAQDHWTPDSQVFLEIRGRRHAARVAPMPFVAHNYYRRPASP